MLLNKINTLNFAGNPLKFNRSGIHNAGGLSPLKPLEKDTVQFSGKIFNENLIYDVLEFKKDLAKKFHLYSPEALPSIGIVRIGIGLTRGFEPPEIEDEHPVAFDVLVKESEFDQIKDRIPPFYKGYEVHVHKVVDCNISPLNWAE